MLNISKDNKIMATWTPNNLTDPGFVRGLSAQDKNQALYYQQQSLERMQAALVRNEREQQAVQQQLNEGEYSFESVREAKKAATVAQFDPNLTAQQKAALQTRYQELQDTRSELLNRDEQLQAAIDSGTQGINTATIGISTLQSQDATPQSPYLQPLPDTTNSPPSDQEGTPPGVTVDNTSITNSVPNNADAGLAPEVLAVPEPEFEYSPLETPPGTDEFDGIDTVIEANENSLQEPPLIDPDQDPSEEANRRRIEDYISITPVTQGDVIDYSGFKGLTGPKFGAQSGATNQEQNNFITQEDWRVRLVLAPGSEYLYNARNPGILKPLQDSKGVIFPYTPTINISYSASYDTTDLIHSNYKVYQYKNSSVDNIQITCDFTAQDTTEANYILAVIHFFRSCTKMFYGKDQNPKPGTPPPLCFLIGLGEFQFNDHPLAITNFNYNLPSDVDYIRAGYISGLAGVNQQPQLRAINSSVASSRLIGIKPGGTANDPYYGSSSDTVNVTYVPTKIQMQITAIPIMSRNDVSKTFSLTDYATGNLLRGIQNVRGGMW